MNKHTQGPWRLIVDMNHAPIVQRRSSGGFSVVDNDHERALADARLIAAAPELLQEMERYLPILATLESQPDWWDFCVRQTGIATLNAYKAAIARAKGEA